MELVLNRFLLIYPLISLYVQLAETNTALVIVDVQNCFLPGGSLVDITNGERMIPVINNIRTKYDAKFTLTVHTQDWHCQNHVSFASQHPGKNVYDSIWLTYDSSGSLCVSASCDVKYNISQSLWPDHCVINTTAAEISTQLIQRNGDITVKKGYTCSVDSYSAFFDNGGFSHTELDSILRQHGITAVVVTGLALDYCVYYTSKDAKKLGYVTYVVLDDASRPVYNVTMETAVDDLRNIGVHLIDSGDLGLILDTSAAGKLTYITSFPMYILCIIFIKMF